MTDSATPLSDAYQGGTFIFYTTMHYDKKPISYAEQLDMLVKRGLIIRDRQFALDQLGIIGYFRLANYLRPMESDKISHIFKPGSTFDNAVRLYYFDKSLRALLFTAIQSVEVALRSRIMHEVAMKYGAFWFMDADITVNHQLANENIRKIRQELDRSKEEFILEHRRKYSCPDFPPVWKSLEVVTFGTLSKLYQNLSDTALKKQIARTFFVPQHIVLESWIKSVAALRNHIAHHSRIWNRNYPQIPQLPAKLKMPWINPAGIIPSKIYPQICCLAYLQNVIHPDNSFAIELKNLVREYSNVDLRAMGFPSAWDSQPLWNTKGRF